MIHVGILRLVEKTFYKSLARFQFNLSDPAAEQGYHVSLLITDATLFPLLPTYYYNKARIGLKHTDAFRHYRNFDYIILNGKDQIKSYFVCSKNLHFLSLYLQANISR